jgi:PAS domain S-box-containing protein
MDRPGSREPDRDVRQEAVLIELEALRHRCAQLEQAAVEAKRTETALTEGERKYRQLFATVSDAIIVFDAETRRFLDVNESALRLYGYTRDEFLSLTHWSITAEPTASEASIREALTGIRLEVPLRYHKKKDGSVFPVEISAGAFVWGGRGVVCGVIRDITERKKADDALRARTQQLEALRAVSAEITRELDLPTLLDLIMHRSTELVGGTSGTIYLWDESAKLLSPRVWSSHGEWMRDGHVRLGEGLTGLVAQRREGLIVDDYRRWPQARPFILEHANVTAVVAEPLLYRDRLLGVIAVDDQGTGRSFTEQDRELLRLFAAQAAVAIENARLFAAAERRATELKTLRDIGQAIAARLELPAVLEAVVAGTMELLGTQHTQIVLWDEATRSLQLGAARGTEEARVRKDRFALGKGAIGAVALTWEPLILNDYRASPHASPDYLDVLATITIPILFEDRLLGVLHSHTTRPGKYFTLNDLRRFQMLATQTAIAIENARLYDQVRQHADELERKVEERTRELQIANTQLRAANTELEAFSYSVSHDLRNPLLSIEGFSQLLLKKYGETLDAEGKDYLQRVWTAAQRMGELIDALLAIARVTRHPLRREPVDLSAMVRAIASDLRLRDSQRAAEVAIQDGLVAQGDARLLRTLLENLLENAWKFTAHRQPTHIEVGRLSAEEGATVYFVRDNGVGFDMAEMDKLFGVFQRLPNAEEFPGTGIGLATVQRIVQRHGGHVWAEGALERGATFFFTIGPPDHDPQPGRQTAG